ncbi:MAG: transporter substrate-binding domain-containing protein [Actinomycetota bacterium]
MKVAGNSSKRGSAKLRTSTLDRRTFLARLGFGAATVTLGPAMLAACGTDQPGVADGGDPLERYRRDGVRAGYADIPPLSMTEGGAIGGSEPKLAELVLERLDISYGETTLADFSTLIPGLQAGRYDIVPSGAFIRPDRCDAAEFSHPTVWILEQLAFPQGNPSGITTYEDLAANPESTMGIIAGGAEREYMLDVGVSPEQVLEFPEMLDGLDAVRAGRIDAFNSDNIAITYTLAQGAYGDLEAGEPFPAELGGEVIPTCLGIAFADANLRDAFNNEFRAVQQDIETLVSLGEPYGLTRQNYEDAAALDIDELCEQLRQGE